MSGSFSSGGKESEDAEGVTVEELYDIMLRKRRPPSKNFLTKLAMLDSRTTLLPHFEPYPLLPAGAWKRDWRGWPPQRPLKMFTAILWRPRLWRQESPPVEAMSRRIEELVRSGSYRVVARYRDELILRRTGLDEQ